MTRVFNTRATAGVAAVLGALSLLLPPARADDWPQWRGPGRDGVWHEEGVPDKLPAEVDAVVRLIPNRNSLRISFPNVLRS